jgi:hypothetical protein
VKNIVEKRLAGGFAGGSAMIEAHIRNGLSKKELMAELLLEM